MACAAAPPPPEMDALLGQTLGGHYHVEAVIGRGAMGVVYRVRHTLLEQDYALKVLHPELTEDPEVRRRFLLEARSLTAFTHKHAVQVRHCGEDHGQLFLVMDLVAGESLAARLEREGALPSRVAAAILVQVLEALEEAHQAGIVHRDVKPANILVEHVERPDGRADERARVVDFGLARWVGPHAETQGSALASQGGRVVGTVAYMAPEQLRCEDVDGRADLFGVGAVLYEALTGERPFPGESLLSVAARVMVDPPRAWSAVDLETVPAVLRAVVERALEKDPDTRFQSAGQMADAVRGALGGAPFAGAPPPPAPPDPRAPAPPAPSVAGHAPAPARRAWLPIALAGGALLGGVVGLLSLAGPSATERAQAALAQAEHDLARGRYGEAREQFARALDLTPGDGLAWLGRAEARTALGERGAEGDLEAAARLLPDDERVAVARAWYLAHVEKDVPRALKELGQALWIDRGSVSVRVARGDIGLAHGDFELVAQDVAALEAAAPEDARTAALLARLLVKRAQGVKGREAQALLQEALPAAERATALDARWAEGPHLASLALGDMSAWARNDGRYGEARQILARQYEAVKEAVTRAERDPSHRRQGQSMPLYYTDRGCLAFRTGAGAAALLDFDRALVLRPRDPDLLGQRAHYLMELGQRERATADYEKLYDITQESNPLFRLGFDVQLLGDEAADQGEVEAALQHYERAEAMYTRALERFPAAVDLRQYRGETRVRLARLRGVKGPQPDLLAQARADFEHVLAGQPDYAETLLRRCECFLVEGRPLDALRDIRVALVEPKDRTSRYHLRRAHAALACAGLVPVPEEAGSSADLLAEAESAASSAQEIGPPRHVPPVLARGQVRVLRAALAADARERARALDQARTDIAVLHAWGDVTEEHEEEARAHAARARATADYLRALVADAAGEPVAALSALRAALTLREGERAAKRWALDATWYDLLARLLEQGGDAAGAAAALERAAAIAR